MGEEKKEEAKKVEQKKEGEAKEEKNKEEEKKEEEKKEEEPQEIALKVDMHCEACARKVARALKGFQGVEDVLADYKSSKVVVKGKTADPMKVCERIRKKSGKKVEIISPLPKPPPEKKDEIKEPPKEEKKQEPPPVITVVLKVRMHCEACAQDLRKRIRKVKGVESVTTDLANDQVTVKGVVDPEKLVSDVCKKTGKQASIVKGEEEEKKEEEKKKEDEKKEDEKKVEEKKEAEEAKAEEDKNTSDIKKSEYWPPKYYMEYEYAYPQYFSDDNPNACCVL